MTYRDELEAARARVDALERDLADARATESELRAELDRERVGRGGKSGGAVRRNPRWHLAASASGALAVVSFKVAWARWRTGDDPFNQIMSGFSALGGAIMVGLGILMVLDAHPLEDDEERKKRRWGVFLVVMGVGFTIWMARMVG